MYWPRGKVWGGSSSLNAMVYIRGHALDYNRWEEEDGALGWRYDNVLPYFKKAQTHELGEDDYRGGSGPLRVCVGKDENGSAKWCNSLAYLHLVAYLSSYHEKAIKRYNELLKSYRPSVNDTNVG